MRRRVASGAAVWSDLRPIVVVVVVFVTGFLDGRATLGGFMVIMVMVKFEIICEPMNARCSMVTVD